MQEEPGGARHGPGNRPKQTNGGSGGSSRGDRFHVQPIIELCERYGVDDRCSSNLERTLELDLVRSDLGRYRSTRPVLWLLR